MSPRVRPRRADVKIQLCTVEPLSSGRPLFPLPPLAVHLFLLWSTLLCTPASPHSSPGFPRSLSFLFSCQTVWVWSLSNTCSWWHALPFTYVSSSKGVYNHLISSWRLLLWGPRILERGNIRCSIHCLNMEMWFSLSSFIKLWENNYFQYSIWESVYFDLIKLKIFHQITQENPGSRNI